MIAATNGAGTALRRRRGRVVRFRLDGRFDGARSATVTIEYHSPSLAFIQVRPFRRRRCYELALGDVAAGVLFDVIKREVAAKRAERRQRRKERV